MDVYWLDKEMKRQRERLEVANRTLDHPNSVSKYARFEGGGLGSASDLEEVETHQTEAKPFCIKVQESFGKLVDEQNAIDHAKS